MPKPKLLLLCGGQSGEHEVSLASAKSVIEASQQHYDVNAIVISKEGKLLSKTESAKALNQGSSQGLSAETALSNLDYSAFDVVFPLLHGPNGEDGSIQGLLQLSGFPYVGSGIAASAVGMDKLLMKAVYAAQALPQIAYAGVNRNEWINRPEKVLEELERLSYPLFVKPANLGSSVGINKVRNKEQLVEALNEAANYDRRIIVEQGLEHPRELEVAILGNENPQASPVGEISFNADFYDYETKYSDGKAELHIPAEIPEEIAIRCQALAIEAFKAIDAAGLARVDFFYDESSQKLFLNEINTMPGFTKTSMYPKLWEAAGINYGELVQRLVGLALESR